MADQIFDVVVIGSGGAGLMAAQAAAAAGSSVIVLEKSDTLGGTTALSVGTISTSGTPHQSAAGIADSPDDHLADMALFAGTLEGRNNAELRKLLVEELPETFLRLLDLGLEFVGPFEEPPHRVPRLHAVVPHSRAYIRQLAIACRRMGAKLVTGSPVEDLIVSSSNTVEGVIVGGAAGPRRVSAKQAVILASGDFSSADRAFKARFMSGPLLQIGGINPDSTGDGQQMGERAGGEILNGDLAWGPEIRFLAPPKPTLVAQTPPLRPIARAISIAMRTLPDRVLRPLLLSYVTTYLAPSHALFRQGAILVNRKGERFCDERERPQDAIGLQPGQEAFIILDGEIASRFEAWPNFISTAPGVGYAYLSDYARSRRDIFHRAEDVPALAARIGVPEAALGRSVEAMDSEKELRPPFIALGPAKSWIVFSEGGLRVDRKLRVLGRDGAPVSGLYAAGSAGQGGAILEGHGHHLAWAFTSGRLAGENAAQER